MAVCFILLVFLDRGIDYRGEIGRRRRQRKQAGEAGPNTGGADGGAPDGRDRTRWAGLLGPTGGFIKRAHSCTRLGLASALISTGVSVRNRRARRRSAVVCAGTGTTSKSAAAAAVATATIHLIVSRH